MIKHLGVNVALDFHIMQGNYANFFWRYNNYTRPSREHLDSDVDSKYSSVMKFSDFYVESLINVFGEWERKELYELED